jgi:4-hydroxy-4-methyl-2-oxoglutarate aldolase
MNFLRQEKSLRDHGACKKAASPLNGPVSCGGVRVHAGDLVVADEEGVVVVPGGRRHEVLRDARAKRAKEDSQSLDDWAAAHRSRIDKILAERGFQG